MARTPPGETRGKVWRFTRERLLAGAPPSLREVQEALGFRSVESARAHLDALVREGKLVKRPGRARGYALAGAAAPAAPSVLVPLVGAVQAGGLAAAVEDPDGFLPVHSRFVADELFALRVRGESMTGAGIFPGDVVIVRRQQDAESGDVVVALVGDEATVKTLRKRRGRIVLQPENPDFPPIILSAAAGDDDDAGDVRLLGRVVEVRRHLGAAPLVDPLPAG